MVGKPYTENARLQLAKERGILVDEQDAWLLSAYTWRIDNDGYARTAIRCTDGTWKVVNLHHAIMGLPIYEEDQIDHINRSTLDNRRSNLRYVSRSEQAINRTRRTNVTGQNNIFMRPDGTYYVMITRSGRKHYLGKYDTLDEAVATREEWLACYTQPRLNS